MAGDRFLNTVSASEGPFEPLSSGLNFSGILAHAATAKKQRNQSGTSSSGGSRISDVWNLSDLDEVTREIPIDTPYVCFRKPSEHRQHRVIAIDEMNKGVFYVNREAIRRVAPALERRISGVAKNRGTVYRDGQIRIGVVEFEILLRLICNSYEGLSRTNAIGKYMKRMLILSDRYEIQSLVEECKQLVRSANFEHVSVEYAVKWFEGFEYSKLDEVSSYYGETIRPMRSQIIAGMINANRWPIFGHRIGRNYTEALKSRLFHPNRRVTPAEVDQALREYFDGRHYGRTMPQGSTQQMSTRGFQPSYAGLIPNSPFMNFDPTFPLLF